MLEEEIKKLKEANSVKLQGEYERLVQGLREAQQRRETEQVLANPVLPEHILDEAIPGSIRYASLAEKYYLLRSTISFLGRVNTSWFS